MPPEIIESTYKIACPKCKSTEALLLSIKAPGRITLGLNYKLEPTVTLPNAEAEVAGFECRCSDCQFSFTVPKITPEHKALTITDTYRTGGDYFGYLVEKIPQGAVRVPDTFESYAYYPPCAHCSWSGFMPGYAELCANCGQSVNTPPPRVVHPTIGVWVNMAEMAAPFSRACAHILLAATKQPWADEAVLEMLANPTSVKRYETPGGETSIRPGAAWMGLSAKGDALYIYHDAYSSGKREALPEPDICTDVDFSNVEPWLLNQFRQELQYI